MKRARVAYTGAIHEATPHAMGLQLADGRVVAEDAVVWLAPFEVGTIIALGLNYADHAEELGLSRPEEPALFWKPNTSLLPHKGVVLYPKGARFVHYEVELAVVVGRPMKKVKAKDALDYVLGYTIANDRLLQGCDILCALA